MPQDYQSLPQTADEADERIGEEEIARATHDSERVDNRIRWIHFVFGSAVLLPWNGEPSLSAST